MRAMVFEGSGRSLTAEEVPRPVPGEGELLIAVHACGVCRTDLHVVDGDLEEPKPHLIPGQALADLRNGEVTGAAVIQVSQGD